MDEIKLIVYCGEWGAARLRPLHFPTSRAIHILRKGE
jgi:hypothetical protein